APVDRSCLSPHVRLPAIRTGFAAAARVFFAAERASDLRAGRADVDVRDAAVAADCRKKPLCVLQAIREDRRRQSMMSAVLLLDCRLEGVDLDQIENRSERLGLNDGPVVARAHDRGLDEIA